MAAKHASQDSALIERIRAMVTPPALPAGSRVPSSRDLGARLGIPHARICRVLRRLAELGVVVPVSSHVYLVAAAKVDSGKRQGPVSDFVAVIGDFNPLRNKGFHFPSDLHAGIMASLDGASRPMRYLEWPQTHMTSRRFQPLHPYAWVVYSVGQNLVPVQIAFLAALASAGERIAVLGDALTPRALGKFAGSAVSSDHRAGGAMLVRHLHARGRRHLSMVVSESTPPPEPGHWLTERIAGASLAAAELGLAAPRILALTDIRASTYKEECAMREQVWSQQLAGALSDRRHPIDAVMTSHDSVAMSLTAVCRKLGRKPGIDIDLTGWDDFWNVLARWPHPEPPCATLDKDGKAIGAALVAAALAEPGRRRLRVPPKLVVPNS